MVEIVIDKERFDLATELGELLGRRRLLAQFSDAVGAAPSPGSAFVFSAAQEAAMGGARAMIERLRPFKPRMVMTIDPQAPAFAIERDLGGRVIRLALPTRSGAPAAQDYGLLVAADMLCADICAMIAADSETARLMAVADRVARSDVTVFINGPTGTGKEVLSRYVHTRSGRAEKAFVAVNCAAIPENMLEAMLFGHEKGAFTGASVANKGIFRAADGGTLLLDEISEMPIALQSKLLRVLQERCVTPLGGQSEIKVDVRIIATTNRDIQTEVREGRFREDLFYRLNVFPLATKPLAARRDDILAIATALLRKHCPEGTPMPWLADDAADVLLAHGWPGNVRELENVIQRALVLHADGRITGGDIVFDAPTAPADLGGYNTIMPMQRRVAGLVG